MERRRSFGVKPCAEGFKDQTKPVLTAAKYERKKKTYSKVILPKQVGLIIPRGPFLNLERFVGLLEGHNWIHTELDIGIDTQFSVHKHTRGTSTGLTIKQWRPSPTILVCRILVNINAHIYCTHTDRHM